MRAQLRVELADRSGRIIACREAHNAVMREGARLIARLFTGDTVPITHMVVGTSDEPESDTYNTLVLANPADSPDALVGGVSAPIPKELMLTSIDEARRLVIVRVRGTMPESAAVGRIREAGLMARTDDGDILYNRVTFAPIDKGNDHELSLFWEVTFPYGDLNWLS
jgi:hypothetical protein